MVFIPPKKKNPETIIQNEVRQLLRMDGWYVIRHQQGLGCHKGLSDLSAIKNGITIYIEIKTPRGVQSDYQKEFMDAAMEQKPLGQLQDSVLSIQNLEGFGQKLMFEMLHLVEFLRNVATRRKDISDRVKW